MTIKTSRRAAVFAAAFLLALPAGLAHAADPVVARVNGKEIHASTLSDLKAGSPQLRQVPIETVYSQARQVYDQLLETAIVAELVGTEARKQKIQDDPDYKKQVKLLENQVLQRIYMQRQVEKMLTDDVLRAKYDEFAKNMTGKEEIHARHILVETEDQAKTVLTELRGGAKFEDLVKKFSKDQGSGENGDLGYFTKDDMVPEFSAAAFALQPGQISDKPVKTQFGWHVIKVEDRRPAQPPRFEDIRDQIKGQLGNQQANQLVEGMRSSAKIDRFAPDGSPLPPAPPPQQQMPASHP